MIEASDRRTITLTVNGERVTRNVESRMHLVDFLREELGLTGSHLGCEHGVCGACTVQLDGRAVRGCLTLAVQVDDANIVTIEGLTDSGVIADVQQAFLNRNSLQCGFCTPGMLTTISDLLARNANPSRNEIRDAISGNYCRCTGYQAIVDAVETVVKTRAKEAAE